MSRNDRYRGGKKVMPPADAFHQAVTNSRTKSVTDYRRTQDLIKSNTPRVSKRTEGAPRNAREARRRGEHAAADQLGVSVRTLRQWTHPNRSRRRAPSTANRARVRDQHNSRDTRQATMPKRRRNRLTKGGMRVTIGANQGPTAHGRKYQRFREIAAEFPPDAAERIMDAFVDGGPEGAQQQLLEEMNSDDGYAAGMSWTMDDITKLQFEERGESDDFDE